jgi:hypothetical protein
LWRRLVSSGVGVVLSRPERPGAMANTPTTPGSRGGPKERADGIDRSTRFRKSFLDRTVCWVQAALVAQHESSPSTPTDRGWKEVP